MRLIYYSLSADPDTNDSAVEKKGFRESPRHKAYDGCSLQPVF
jgi:hypothetical protein